MTAGDASLRTCRTSPAGDRRQARDHGPLDPGLGPGVRADRRRDRRPAGLGRARRAQGRPVRRVVRELAPLRRQPGVPPPSRDLRESPVRGVRPRLRGRRSTSGTRTPSLERSPRAARSTSSSWPSTPTATRCGPPTCHTRSEPRWHSERDIVGELAEAVRSVGLRFGLYYCGGFDWSFNDRRVGSMADSILAVPRGPYPAYADAQVRELIERYRPSVLWNDVAWPGRATDLRPPHGRLLPRRARRGAQRSVDAVEPAVLRGAARPGGPAGSTGRRRRSAKETGGLVAPRPPHFDVRTPEYATLDEIQSRRRSSWCAAWTRASPSTSGRDRRTS